MSGGERHRYSVAWLDLLGGRAEDGTRGRQPRGSAGQRRGSAVRPGIADFARCVLARRSSYPQALSRQASLEVPSGFPAVLLRPASMRAFNALRWRAAPRRERERPLAMAPYFFPLDALGEWNRLYGPAGLIQYQFVIPRGQEAALERCFELMRTRRLPVYLAVFKRFGAAFGGPLSFPLEGWTLAIDLPAGGARACGRRWMSSTSSWPAAAGACT